MKRVFIVFGFCLVGLALIASIYAYKFAIPPKSNRVETETHSGRVVKITTCCGGGDIIFHLANPNGESYYINRGEEAGLVVAQLKKELLNKDITVATRFGHICELRTDDSVYYTELVD